MIGYVMVGTNDMEQAIAFYDRVLAPLGVKRIFQSKKAHYWGIDINSPSFAVTTPFNDEPAAPGNGNMVALRARSREVVDEVHALALAAGGADEGAPGPRGDPAMKFYGGYFRDLDGNKLNAFVIG